eukprot:TRINITY_DN38815_c0_g1_i1.p1 TRINITY_DN38815_c0_g1~~TRINITY_DN38815_c0_g1_i1.p1  ORF type:complete len:454 (+),score=83.41 TRINITY_DN38815_c0_g1_i1:119-1480(+)
MTAALHAGAATGRVAADAQRQVLVVGLLAFCGPGLFNALNGLGNAGSDDASIAAVANSCLYLTFAVSSYFAGAVFNILGPVPLFVLGGLSYAAYALCIFFSTRQPALAVIGGIVLGVGAGLFWTAQGALMMAYATPKSRGRLIGIFWAIFNLGGVAGGLLQFGLNYDNAGASASPASYFIFVAAMLVGALSAPLLLASPSQVVREDGSAVVFEQADSPLEEIRAAAQAIGDPFIKGNILFYLASNWFYTYDFSGFNGSQFNMRTRGLNSATFWGAQMLAAYLFGRALDGPSLPVSRARRGLVMVQIALVLSLGLALWSNTGSFACNGGHGWDKGHPCRLDFAKDFPASVLPMSIYALLGAADAMFQTYAYWLMSMAAGTNVRKTVMFAAAYKGLQSLGAGASWMVDLPATNNYSLQGYLCLVFTVVSSIPVAWTLGFIDPLKLGKSIDGKGSP